MFIMEEHMEGYHVFRYYQFGLVLTRGNDQILLGVSSIAIVAPSSLKQTYIEVPIHCLDSSQSNK